MAILTLLACGPGSPSESAKPPIAQATGSPVAPTATSDNRRILVALGDSLTEGLGLPPDQAYPAQLERQLRASGLAWKVVNAGYSGETTSGALSRLQWVLKLKPDAVILVTGGNDGLRGIDPKVTQQNISALIGEFQKRDIPVLLAGMKTLTNLGVDYTSAFEAVYPTVAKEKKVPLIPFFLEGVGGVAKLNQDDRIHPTEEGYAEIVKRITPVVVPWLKGLPQ